MLRSMLHRIRKLFSRARLTLDDDHPLPAISEVETEISIESFVFFLGFIHLRGWICALTDPVVRLEFRISAEVRGEGRLGLASPGASNPNSGFELRLMLSDPIPVLQDPSLLLTHASGAVSTISNIGLHEVHSEKGHQLFATFLKRVASMPVGNFLEIGSRARSGNVRRDLVPPGWSYTGFDITPGENVDVVGDAHQMSARLPHNHFNAVMSLSVFEHLIMPWKVVLEMNRAMVKGGIAFIYTHQAFPLHDKPWDYFRFSTWVWPRLFNAKTGFRILDVGTAEPAYIIGQRWNPGVNHGLETGTTVSSVLVEKIDETQLEWPVTLDEIVETKYPY